MSWGLFAVNHKGKVILRHENQYYELHPDFYGGTPTFVAQVWGEESPVAVDFDAQLLLQRYAQQLLELLKTALKDSGCDGDLCARVWHEEARELINVIEKGSRTE